MCECEDTFLVPFQVWYSRTMPYGTGVRMCECASARMHFWSRFKYGTPVLCRTVRVCECASARIHFWSRFKYGTPVQVRCRTVPAPHCGLFYAFWFCAYFFFRALEHAFTLVSYSIRYLSLRMFRCSILIYIFLFYLVYLFILLYALPWGTRATSQGFLALGTGRGDPLIHSLDHTVHSQGLRRTGLYGLSVTTVNRPLQCNPYRTSAFIFHIMFYVEIMHSKF
jgi:hypothetical protein